MFSKTLTKLTALYLAIIMTISLFFSINVYQLSTEELDRGFDRQRASIERIPGLPLTQQIRERFLQIYELEYDEAKGRIFFRLLLTNMIILAGGGLVSYYLARRSLKPIQEAHESLERFTADASHELRTPIAAMKSEIEVALMDPKLSLKRAKGQLNSNLEELAKLTALSDGLLRLARLDKDDLPRHKLPLTPLAEQAIERVQSRAETKRISITLNSPVELSILGDKESLVEALVTVLDNAIKYSSENASIEVRTGKQGNQAFLSISDKGIGIATEDLPHIFDRFYQADSARSKQQDAGYGLGLAIAKNIVDLHGGSITARSTAGQGSTFTIYLQAG